MAECIKCHSHDIIESEKGIYCCNCGWDSEKEEYAKKKTNADRIRSMSDEELEDFMYAKDIPWCDDSECPTETLCKDCFRKWLQQEVE